MMQYITIANTNLPEVHEAIGRNALKGFKVHTFTATLLLGGAFRDNVVQYVVLMERSEGYIP